MLEVKEKFFMQRIGIYQNYTPNFKAIYTNPDGSKVNISEKAIAEITHTKIIKKAIDLFFIKLYIINITCGSHITAHYLSLPS